MAGPNKSTNLVPKQQDLSQSSAREAPKKVPESYPQKFFRMKRKGNGWIGEEVTIHATGKLSFKDLGDWDVRGITEQKVLSEIVLASLGAK